MCARITSAVAIGGEATAGEGTYTTPKIYGAAHPRDHADKTIRQGLNDLRGQLGETIQRALLRPQAVVASGDAELLARLSVLARAFGSRQAPPTADQLTVRWPRGPAGFRACATVLGDTPSGGWLSSLTVRMP